MRRVIRVTGLLVLAVSMLVANGCGSAVGIGMSVGVPVGTQGYMSVGASRWR
jgi:hypothetical protein